MMQRRTPPFRTTTSKYVITVVVETTSKYVITVVVEIRARVKILIVQLDRSCS